MKKLSIIGGGPSALILAAEIDTTKYQVTLYDQKKSVGRKFLVAGEGGLNLTFNSPLDEFTSKYFPREFMEPIIKKFTNKDWINWLNNHDIPTFIGSSNRVFPAPGLKPIEVLNKIVEIVSANGVRFQLGTKWNGWNEDGSLCFEGLENVDSDITVFAMGGSSWTITGSDGKWVKAFEERGVVSNKFRAANCAFGVNWNKDFIKTHEGNPLKNIALNFNGNFSKGELVISKFGLEGNAIYALSQKIQEELLTEENAIIHLDLKPTITVNQIEDKLKNSKSSKITEILKKDIKLDRTSIALLKQFSNRESFLDMNFLAKAIKSLPITLTLAAELEEAISSLGGISLDEIDNNFQLKKIPNSYAIGEMLDWFGPTGGYLLNGSFSMGFALAKYFNELK